MAVLTFTWPYKLGLMAAAVMGILVGVVLESRRPRAARRTAPEEAGP